MTQEQRRAVERAREWVKRRLEVTSPSELMRTATLCDLETAFDVIDDQQRRLDAVIEATHENRYMHGDCETAFNDIRDDIRRIATGDTEPEDDDPFGPVTEAELEAAKVKLDDASLILPRIKPGSVEAAHARIDELAARVELNFTLGQGRYATLERHVADPMAHKHKHSKGPSYEQMDGGPKVPEAYTGPPVPMEDDV